MTISFSSALQELINKMLLSLVNCAVLTIAQLTSESNIIVSEIYGDISEILGYIHTRPDRFENCVFV